MLRTSATRSASNLKAVGFLGLPRGMYRHFPVAIAADCLYNVSMIEHKANTYRLYPTPKQAQQMAQIAGSCRSGIYCITHEASGRIYIGSSTRLRNRWYDHKRDLRAGRHHTSRLQRAWDKYGDGAFVFEILEYVPDVLSLLQREQHWLDRLRPFDRAIGFNSSPTAGSAFGVKHTDQSRAKFRAGKLGKPILTPRHPEAKKNMGAGLRASAKAMQHQKALTAAHIGKKRSDETKAAIKAGITLWWAKRREAGSIRRAA